MTEDLKEQIRKAQAEMATWSESKRNSVRLEGTDLWLSIASTQGADARPVAIRYDGDDRESRTAFRAYDSVSGPVSGRTSWQIWRDACAWQAARALKESK